MSNINPIPNPPISHDTDAPSSPHLPDDSYNSFHIHPDRTASQSIWRAYSEFKRLSRCQRVGHAIGSAAEANPASPAPFFSFRPESVLEHCAGVVYLCQLISAYYPKLLPPAKLPNFNLLALLHEIHETESGDIPDNGSEAHSVKFEAEYAHLERHLESYLPSQASAVLQLFKASAKNPRENLDGGLFHSIDKIEFCLQCLLYDQAHPAKSFPKNYPLTAQDQVSIDITDTRCTTDNFLCSTLQKICHYPFYPLFLDILYVAWTGIFCAWPAWFQNCPKEVQSPAWLDFRNKQSSPGGLTFSI